MKKILLSVMTLVLVLGLVGAGAFAYFSDTETSSDNTFTAGTLDLLLSNDAVNYGDGVTATWKSPDGWAPGDEVTATIWLKNEGTVDAHVAYGDWANPSYGDPNLLKVIEVTEMRDSVGGATDYVSMYVTVYDANNDGKLSLWELITGDAYWPGSASPWEELYYNNDPNIGPPLLPAGGTFWLLNTFKFMETAGNNYQGTTASFDLVLKATQEGPVNQAP